jgi:hypothetical protein
MSKPRAMPERPPRTTAPSGRAERDYAALAKRAIARRRKPSDPLGKVRILLTLPVELAEWYAAQAIRQERNLEQLLVEQIQRGAP